MIYSTSLGLVDALLPDGTKLCLIDTQPRFTEISSGPISPHQLTAFALKSLYRDTNNSDQINCIHAASASLLEIDDIGQFGEIVAKCTLRAMNPQQGRNAKCAPPKGMISSAGIIRTAQTIPGLGPKQAKKVMEHFGSLFNLANARLGQLENVLGKGTAMSVYQFLHSGESPGPGLS